MEKRSVLFSNYIWRTMEKIGSRGVTLVVTFVLARLLNPSDYGEIAIITVLLNLLSVFVDSGFGSALIQKADTDDLDFSSVFFFNLAICLVLYGMMFALAPLIASFYEMEHLRPVIRVQSLLLIISGVKSIQTAYVAKKMIFRRFFFATLGGTIGAAVIGIWMAYRGYGVWSLVAQSLVNNLLDTVILWLTVKWHPEAAFSFSRLKTLFPFGSKLLVSSLVEKLYWDGRQLIIGRIYTTADLAYFNRGGSLPREIAQPLLSGMEDVLFPAMSEIQNDTHQLKEWVRKSIRLNSFLFCPAIFGMAAVAESLIRVLYSDKWISAVSYAQILCMTFLLSCIARPNLSAIKALGRSDIVLLISYICVALHLIGLLATVRHSVTAIAVALLITTILNDIAFPCFGKRLFQYSIWQQLRDVLPYFLLSAFMGACVWTLNLLHLPPLVTLAAQIITGVVLYAGGAAVLRLEMYRYTLKMVKTHLYNLKFRS